jgi:hypothetical protein
VVTVARYKLRLRTRKLARVVALVCIAVAGVALAWVLDRGGQAARAMAVKPMAVKPRTFAADSELYVDEPTTISESRPPPILSKPSVPASWESNKWRSPLGYMHCAYNGRTVRCMTTSGKNPGHEGYTLVVGYRRAWQGDYDSVTYDPAGMPVLRWGSHHDFGRYRCVSRRVGMICVNRWNGHGFHLSLTQHADRW